MHVLEGLQNLRPWQSLGWKMLPCWPSSVRRYIVPKMVLLELLWLSSWLLSPLATAHNIHELSPRATTTVPAPIVFPPSQEFQGNDGPWSTFTLRLGTPEQDVNVMVSTASYQTWAVIPQGCTSEDPSNCKDLRGGEFNYNDSSTWVQNNVTEDGFFALNLEINLGYGPDGNGLFGYDTVGLSWMGSGGKQLILASTES